MLSGVPIPADSTIISVRLYHDSATKPSTYPVYFDQAILTAGYLPAGGR